MIAVPSRQGAMKIAVGSDERTHLTDSVVRKLQERGIDVELCGALKGEALSWVDVAGEVAEKMTLGKVAGGILFCWTGTGVSIAANKVPGVRAALCADADTARGARKWNDANILVMSLRLTSEPVAEEILEAWFNTPFPEEEAQTVAKVARLEAKYTKKG